MQCMLSIYYFARIRKKILAASTNLIIFTAAENIVTFSLRLVQNVYCTNKFADFTCHNFYIRYNYHKRIVLVFGPFAADINETIAMYVSYIKTSVFVFVEWKYYPVHSDKSYHHESYSHLLSRVPNICSCLLCFPLLTNFFELRYCVTITVTHVLHLTGCICASALVPVPLDLFFSFGNVMTRILVCFRFQFLQSPFLLSEKCL